MEYRPLGKTGLRVSAIGLGTSQLGTMRTERAVEIVHRALDLGVTYFDTARRYWDAEINVGIGLEGRRAGVVLSTNTGARTRDDAWRQIEESLTRLRTDYVDNCHLHCLSPGADMEARLGPGGALEALVEAKAQGLVRHIGCTAHNSRTLIEALDRFDFENMLILLKIVNREALKELIPLCHKKGVGVTVMKSVATGVLPAALSLKWLLNQPIATVVPGVKSLAEVEENTLVGHGDYRLTPQDEAQIREWEEGLAHTRCRLCADCMPCPQGIPISWAIGSDTVYSFYRDRGAEFFRAYPWSRTTLEHELPHHRQVIAQIESCTRCGACDARCPYGLPVMEMLEDVAAAMREMVAIWDTL